MRKLPLVLTVCLSLCLLALPAWADLAPEPCDTLEEGDECTDWEGAAGTCQYLGQDTILTCVATTAEPTADAGEPTADSSEPAGTAEQTDTDEEAGSDNTAGAGDVVAPGAGGEGAAEEDSDDDDGCAAAGPNTRNAMLVLFGLLLALVIGRRVRQA